MSTSVVILCCYGLIIEELACVMRFMYIMSFNPCTGPGGGYHCFPLLQVGTLKLREDKLSWER